MKDSAYRTPRSLRFNRIAKSRTRPHIIGVDENHAFVFQGFPKKLRVGLIDRHVIPRVLRLAELSGPVGHLDRLHGFVTGRVGREEALCCTGERRIAAEAAGLLSMSKDKTASVMLASKEKGPPKRALRRSARRYILLAIRSVMRYIGDITNRERR